MHSTSGACRLYSLGPRWPALLLSHPSRQAQQPGEFGIEAGITFDLAGNVPDDAAEIGLECAQSPVGALELLGMGVTLILDEGELADSHVRLPELDAEPFGQLHQLLAGPVQQLGVGRERNVLRLHRGIDNDAREV